MLRFRSRARSAFSIEQIATRSFRNGAIHLRSSTPKYIEIFRADLAQVYAHERKSSAGRKPIDPVLMFKIVTLQRLYNLSDDQTEYEIRDWGTFQRFLGLQVEDGSPDAKTSLG